MLGHWYMDRELGGSSRIKYSLGFQVAKLNSVKHHEIKAVCLACTSGALHCRSLSVQANWVKV